MFAIALLFSVSGFYEIIEVWDERYFHGKRIWSPYDAPNDLQWDLTGAVIGAALTYAILKKSHSYRSASIGSRPAALRAG